MPFGKTFIGAQSFKKTLPNYISVESLINEVFDKNTILATFSFAKRQEPVKTETTEACLNLSGIECCDRNEIAAQCYLEGINQQKSVRDF